MRALRDFNIPKIVKEDEVVFFGLLGDLFPGLDPPRKVDEEARGAVCARARSSRSTCGPTRSFMPQGACSSRSCSRSATASS